MVFTNDFVTQHILEVADFFEQLAVEPIEDVRKNSPSPVERTFTQEDHFFHVKKVYDHVGPQMDKAAKFLQNEPEALKALQDAVMEMDVEMMDRGVRLIWNVSE